MNRDDSPKPDANGPSSRSDVAALADAPLARRIMRRYGSSPGAVPLQQTLRLARRATRLNAGQPPLLTDLQRRGTAPDAVPPGDGANPPYTAFPVAVGVLSRSTDPESLQSMPPTSGRAVDVVVSRQAVPAPKQEEAPHYSVTPNQELPIIRASIASTAATEVGYQGQAMSRRATQQATGDATQPGPPGLTSRPIPASRPAAELPLSAGESMPVQRADQVRRRTTRVGAPLVRSASPEGRSGLATTDPANPAVQRRVADGNRTGSDQGLPSLAAAGEGARSSRASTAIQERVPLPWAPIRAVENSVTGSAVPMPSNTGQGSPPQLARMAPWPELPLVTLAMTDGPPRIQRQSEEAPNPVESRLVTGSEGLPEMTASEPAAEVDITQLADRVYQILVRRLARERERRGL